MSRFPAVQPLLKHRSSSLYRGNKWWLENATIRPLSSEYIYGLYRFTRDRTAPFIWAPISTVHPFFIGGDLYATA